MAWMHNQLLKISVIRFYNIQKNRGFTLLELLVVIAIIGVLSAVVIASLNVSRTKARNEAVISQMFEYQKSLELEYTNTGIYPRTNSNRKHRYCIGEGLSTGERCMGNLTTAYNPAAAAPVEGVFLSHMSALPRFNQPRGSLMYSSPAYSGCTGIGIANTSCTTGDYSIWFLLEGTNESCGRALVANSNLSGEYTLCRLMSE